MDVLVFKVAVTSDRLDVAVSGRLRRPSRRRAVLCARENPASSPRSAPQGSPLTALDRP